MSTSSGPTHRPSSDAALVELLRVDGPSGIGDLARSLGVTATAVRQRLDRLIKAGLVARSSAPADRAGRGRPAHRYGLTEKGRRLGGDNFRDLALVLWRELKTVSDPLVRRGLLARVGSALGGLYRGEITGETPRERLQSVASLLRERNLSCGVESVPAAGGLPVLTAYACPYPELAEQDRGICAAERAMLEDLVGAGIRLSECRLDGADCCRFTATESPPAPEPLALENMGVGASNAVRFPLQSHPESAS